MLVSIIVTTYNGEKYLQQQLMSIKSQSCKNIEIIICDDASTDNTKNIILQFAKNNSNVSYYFNETNIGVNKNFELGFLKAKGDFIAISDQDDIWLPTKIEKQIKMFSNDNIVLAHTTSARFKGSNFPAKTYKKSTKLFEGNDVRKLLLRNSVSGHNMIFRINLLKYILPIPNNIYYDWWIVQTAACNGYVAASQRVLAFQRVHETNVTVKARITDNQHVNEYEERKIALKLFLHLKNLKAEDKLFIDKTIKAFCSLENQHYSKKLFNFLMEYKNIFFFYKKGLLRYFSQKKAAKKMSYRETI